MYISNSSSNSNSTGSGLYHGATARTAAMAVVPTSESASSETAAAMETSSLLPETSTLVAPAEAGDVRHIDTGIISSSCPTSLSFSVSASRSQPKAPSPVFSPTPSLASTCGSTPSSPLSLCSASLSCTTATFQHALRLKEGVEQEKDSRYIYIDHPSDSTATTYITTTTSTRPSTLPTGAIEEATDNTQVPALPSQDKQTHAEPTNAVINAATITATESSPLLDFPTEILEEIVCRLAAPRNFVRSCRQIYHLSRSPSLRAKYLWLLHGPDQVLTRKIVEQHKMTTSILTPPVALLLMTMGASHRDPEEFIFRWACSNGHADIVRHLLKSCEPKIDLRFRTDWFLREAAKNGHQDVVSILLRHADYEPSESGLNKAFEAAYEQSHCSTVKALLDYAESRGAKAQQLELERWAAAPRCGPAPPSIFQSVVPSTRRAKRVLAGGLFIQKDADKALRYAVRGNDVEMVRLLMDYEADVHAFDEEAILVAAHKGHVEILRILIQAGADIETKAGAPLRQAAEGGHTEAVKVLCESGADTMWGGCSALRTATSQGFDTVIAILLEHGANVNIHEGTPLQVACRHGHEAAVRVLLQYGANHRLDDGAAYKLALEANHEGIKVLLIQAETTMRARERELDRIMKQQGMMMAQQQQQSQPQQPMSPWCNTNVGAYYENSGIGIITANPGFSTSPSMNAFTLSDGLSRGHKRIYSQISSNPLSVADLFRSGSICGLVALDDEIRSRQRSESNRL